jgi:hypothetical protein
MTTNGPLGCFDGRYVKKLPARKAPKRIEVPAYAAIEMKADSSKIMGMMFERWSYLWKCF